MTSSRAGGRQSRPAPVEWPDGSLLHVPHGTPLLRDGKLTASRRDATFVLCPNVTTIKAVHVVVVSHEIAIGSGCVGVTSACDSRTTMLQDDMLEDAECIHPNGRCQRPGCRQLFALAGDTGTHSVN